MTVIVNTVVEIGAKVKTDTYNADTKDLLRLLLYEQRITNLHLLAMTDETIKTNDVKED